MRIISLTTDFGARDWFVGTMKGVIVALQPRAQVIDLAHEIPPGDVRAGAFALMAGCRYFPKGTVHVAVVDPGVGGRRRALAVETANGIFVGPDNGVLSWALMRENIRTIRRLERPKYFLEPVSRTFHGRDIFAPVAAHLSRGLPIQKLGPEVDDFQRLPWARPVKRGAWLQGEIIHLDRFGDAITNIDAVLLPADRDATVTCEVAGKLKLRCGVARCYSAVPVNAPVAVIGSSGFLEVAVNGGSAAKRFGLSAGNNVRIYIRPSPGGDGDGS